MRVSAMVVRCWPCCTCAWVWLSVINAVSSCISYYLPFWLIGYLPSLTHLHRPMPTYFGSFRRCTFPRTNSGGQFEIVEECGRYATFNDIPTWPWQVTTVCCGLGCGLSLFVAAIAATAWCFNVSLSRRMFRVLGAIHLTAGLLVIGGLAFFPFGWLDNPEVNVACTVHGDSALELFYLGHCRLWWSFYVLLGSTAMSLFLSLTSCCCCFGRGASKGLNVSSRNEFGTADACEYKESTKHQQKPLPKATRSSRMKYGDERLLQIPSKYQNSDRILVDDRGFVQILTSDDYRSDETFRQQHGVAQLTYPYDSNAIPYPTEKFAADEAFRNVITAGQHPHPSNTTHCPDSQQSAFRPDLGRRQITAQENLASSTRESIDVNNVNSYEPHSRQQQRRRQIIV